MSRAVDALEGVEIDADIRRARTLPAWLYADADVLALARERVFARSWQLAGDLAQVRVPGAVQPFTFLEGLVEEPLLLTRDRDDRLHCLSNVCTHRGTVLCEHPAVATGPLRCRYHGRRFQLDGRMHSMPEFEGVEHFPGPSDDLPAVPFAVSAPWIFASLAPAWELEHQLAPVRERCGHLPFERAVLDKARSRDYLVQANWALYVDNYLEGFHIPYVHAGLSEALDYGAYRTEAFELGNLQLGVGRDGDAAFALPPDHPDAGQPVAAWYWWLFPNTMLNLYPWGCSVNVVKPLAVDRTRVSFLAYVWDDTLLARGAGATLDRVEREDEAIVESVQRGVRARLYQRGRYSPAREAGVHQFHRLLVAALKG